jgi:hypothetical protein
MTPVRFRRMAAPGDADVYIDLRERLAPYAGIVATPHIRKREPVAARVAPKRPLRAEPYEPRHFSS